MCHPRILCQGEHITQLTTIYKCVDFCRLMNLEESVAHIRPIKHEKLKNIYHRYKYGTTEKKKSMGKGKI